MYSTENMTGYVVLNSTKFFSGRLTGAYKRPYLERPRRFLPSVTDALHPPLDALMRCRINKQSTGGGCSPNAMGCHLRGSSVRAQDKQMQTTD